MYTSYIFYLLQINFKNGWKYAFVWTGKADSLPSFDLYIVNLWFGEGIKYFWVKSLSHQVNSWIVPNRASNQQICDLSLSEIHVLVIVIIDLLVEETTCPTTFHSGPYINSCVWSPHPRCLGLTLPLVETSQHKTTTASIQIFIWCETAWFPAQKPNTNRFRSSVNSTICLTQQQGMKVAGHVTSWVNIWRDSIVYSQHRFSE